MMDDQRHRRGHGGRPSPSARRAPPPDATGNEGRFVADKKEASAQLNVYMRDGECVTGHIEYFDRDMIKIVPKSGPTVFIRKNQIRMIEEP